MLCDLFTYSGSQPLQFHENLLGAAGNQEELSNMFEREGGQSEGKKDEKQLDQWSLIQSVISYMNAGLKHTNLIACTLPKVAMEFDSILSNLNPVPNLLIKSKSFQITNRILLGSLFDGK